MKRTFRDFNNDEPSPKYNTNIFSRNENVNLRQNRQNKIIQDIMYFIDNFSFNQNENYIILRPELDIINTADPNLYMLAQTYVQNSETYLSVYKIQDKYNVNVDIDDYTLYSINLNTSSFLNLLGYIKNFDQYSVIVN